MASIKGGFTYVSGPLFVREFNLKSTTTVKALMPVKAVGSNIVESLGSDSILAGFIQHDAANSVPAGKCLVLVPVDQDIFSATAGDGVASTLSSGATLGQFKSGNSWYLSNSASTVSAMYIAVPREDGTIMDSTDSSVWVQVIGAALVPFGTTVQAPVI